MPGELHLWRIDLDDAAVQQASTRDPCLSPGERERAARMPEPARARWCAARSAQRRILGGYLGAVPHELEFTTRAGGKPGLDLSTAPRFNLTHTAGIGLLAIAAEREVGIDVERLRRVPNAVGIARRVLPESEVAVIVATPVQERHRLFLEAWTRHEAVAKLTGAGVFGRARLEPPPGSRLFGFVPARHYIACVAVRGAAPRLQAFRYA